MLQSHGWREQCCPARGPGAIRYVQDVYTYAQNEEHYGVHLEYPDLLETSINNTLDIYDNINYESLCDLVQAHLDINPIEV